MRFKFLLFLIFASRILNAQCDYPDGVDTTLIISEARLMSDNWAYVELTNVGSTPIFLNEYKLGRLTQWSVSRPIFDLCNDPWTMNGVEAYLFLPEVVLNPNESWVITAAFDFGPEYYKEHLGRLGGSERPKQLGMYDVADKLIHEQEPIGGETFPGDSVTTVENDPEQTVKRGSYSSIFNGVGGGVFYLEQLYTATDSARVDQIGGFFDNGGGRNIPHAEYSVAGVNNGLRTSVLVRKNTIKEGNLDFANSVGLSLDDSDWIPIEMPAGYDQWRDIWWTIGNHGNFVLDENTLAPTLEDISVDYTNKKITVPWGIRRLDEIMRNMEKKPGIAWNYVLNNVVEDSLYRSARTGDKLILYAVGNTLTTDTFDIVVTAPTADDNIVVPIDHRSSGNALTNNAQNGILSWPRVTKHESGTDTITGAGFGLEFDLRVDSLMKYLEKPANAAWEIVWIDGVERADLKNGDILKVTSESGNAKEYFIQIQTYRPSSNANLAAITWPDIPDRYNGFAGWTGDTIPNFSPGTRNYRLKVPFDVKDVPALFATKQDYNAKVKTTRARSINGNREDRTVIFEVTAEDDSTSLVYTVELIKEKHPDNVEPYTADPFISEFVNSYGGVYVELFNPGNQPIDLRNYALGGANRTDNYAPIKHTQVWLYRWMVYVPGTKYVDEATWEVTPKMLLPDPNVNPILRGGETFVMALIGGEPDYAPPYNVNFRHGNPAHPNPWNEDMKGTSTRGVPMPPNGNRNNSFYLYKIFNDSIKLGLKPIGDVNDFENIDTWGMPDGNGWIVGDYVLSPRETGNIFKRKPEIIKGNPERGGSFGLDNPDNSEWIRINPGVDYATVPSSQRQAAALGGVGSHFMEPITFYKSTVSSLFYKISAGFGHDEEILGVVTGTTVSEFINNIYKEDEDQAVEIRSGADTIAVLEQNAVISPNDVLVVLSADSTNTTYYRLDVTDEGLNSNAVLTSSRYTIEISVSPNVDQDVVGEASISRLEYGSTLKNIMSNINVPHGATVTIINDKGDYVPLKRLNYDTLYVFKTVSPEISLDVLAEDGKTRIVYNLVPTSKEDDAFILSDVYLVSQINNLIEYVPLGITFSEFVNNITPSYNSSLKLVDKMGMERTTGEIKADDKVVVTSANGEVSNSYYISLLFPGNTKATYLAYVVSEAYSVNQVDYIISGTVESTLTNAITVAEFMQQVIPSIGATIVIIDAEENEKTSGNLAEGDRVKVTSGDGALVAYYDIILTGTSSRMPMLANLEIYPNPTSGLLNINGLDAGNRVQIYNNQGKLMREFEAHNYHETLTLESLPDGLFLIVISDKNQILGQFKAMKK